MALVQDQNRQICTLAVSVISALAGLTPIHAVAATEDIVVALASVTSEDDAWTTHETCSASNTLLKSFAHDSKSSTFWNILESILKNRVKPLFAKSKNLAITATGRKNLHPIPLPRFDLSVLDPETKPWKIHDVHITTVFSWIIHQYQVCGSYIHTLNPANFDPVNRYNVSGRTLSPSSAAYPHVN
jgi:hypothetical protein